MSPIFHLHEFSIRIPILLFSNVNLNICETYEFSTKNPITLEKCFGCSLDDRVPYNNRLHLTKFNRISSSSMYNNLFYFPLSLHENKHPLQIQKQLLLGQFFFPLFTLHGCSENVAKILHDGCVLIFLEIYLHLLVIVLSAPFVLFLGC